MSLNYFNAADLVQLDATFNYTARSGVGFAITPDNEQVFVSVSDITRNELEVGDTLRVWATDNYASPQTAHHPSRWRAVRIEITSRMKDVVRKTPNIVKQDTLAQPHPTDFVGLVSGFMDQLRPWSVQQLTQAIARTSVPLSGTPDLIQKVGGRLQTLHKNGDIAALKIYARGEQQAASAVYYAKDIDVFYDHLNTPLSDAE